MTRKRELAALLTAPPEVETCALVDGDGARKLEVREMRIERRFTKAGQSAYADIEFRKATSEIKNPDGSIVFRLENIDVPAQFSQVAADILAQKYFRKAGVPAKLKKVEENAVRCACCLTSRLRAPSPMTKAQVSSSGSAVKSAASSRIRIVTGVSSGDVLPVSCGDDGC